MSTNDDLEIRQQIFEFDQRMAARELQHTNELARIKLEQEATDLHDYASRRITEAHQVGKISAAFVEILQTVTFSSYAQVDSAISAAMKGTQDAQATAQAQPDTSPPEPVQDELEPPEQALSSWDEFVSWRRQQGIDSRGIENVGRAPGRERQEFRGHTLEDGSGFPDWRDNSLNGRVYESQLRDNRR